MSGLAWETPVKETSAARELFAVLGSTLILAACFVALNRFGLAFASYTSLGAAFVSLGISRRVLRCTS